MALPDPRNEIHRLVGSSSTVSVGPTSQQSVVFTGAAIEVSTNALCHIRFGANPVAVGTDMLLVPGQERKFTVTAGERFAVIQDRSSTGAVTMCRIEG